MAITTTSLRRVFTYNGMSLNDPSAGMSVEQIKSFYATQFPELLNAVVEGPTTKGAVATYSFIRAAGAKG